MEQSSLETKFHKLLEYLNFMQSGNIIFEKSIIEKSENKFIINRSFRIPTNCKIHDHDESYIELDFNTKTCKYITYLISGHNGDPYRYREEEIPWLSFLNNNFELFKSHAAHAMKEEIKIKEQNILTAKINYKLKELLGE